MGWYIGAILSLLTSVEAYSYPSPVDFDGNLMKWATASKERPIYYQVDGDFEDDISSYGYLVDESATMWSSVSNSYLRLAPVPQGEKADVTVMFKRSFSGDGFSSGFSVFDEYEDRTPIHCSITILSILSLSDIARTILHEFGHCVGLGHSLVPEAVMSYRLEENSFKLDTDDMAAVARLYPVDASEKSLPPGCTVGGGQIGNLWVILLWIVVGFRGPALGRWNRFARGIKAPRL